MKNLAHLHEEERVIVISSCDATCHHIAHGSIAKTNSHNQHTGHNYNTSKAPC